MTTERKRTALNLSGFTPREAAPPAVPAREAAEIAKQEGFRSTTATPPAEKPAAPPAPARRPPAQKAKDIEYVRQAIDIPKALREALIDGARKTGLGTVRAVILDALRAKGYPVSDDELQDKRSRR